MRLEITDLTVRRGSRLVLDHATLSVAPGEFVGLVGPNGAGKTTLMRAALGLLPAAGGASNLSALPPARRARMAAWLPQEREAAWPITVEALIRLGRIPHRQPDADPALIAAALTQMGLEDLRHRPIDQLSGGEQARTLIARALAQDTPILMADEPIAGLDPAHQITAMERFRSLASDQGRTVIASLHDLGLAARHCTRLVMIRDGRIMADGAPAEVLRHRNLQEVFGIGGYFYAETAGGPVFQPLHTVS